MRQTTRAVQSQSLIGSTVEFVEQLDRWERATTAAAGVVSLITLVAAPFLAVMIILKPRRAGTFLILLLVTGALGGAAHEVQIAMDMTSIDRWLDQTPWIGDSLVSYMVEDMRWLLRAEVFPALLGLWYIAAARRRLGSSIEYEGRRWDPAPPVWRSLAIIVLTAILVQFVEIHKDGLRSFVHGVLSGYPLGHKPEYAHVGIQNYGEIAAILALACGILICAVRRRRLWVYMLALAVVLVLSRATYYALLEGIDEKQRNWWSYLREYAPILAALTALFCYVQENDWTEERHVVCGACGYFMGGAEGPKCPECGAARPAPPAASRSNAAADGRADSTGD